MDGCSNSRFGGRLWQILGFGNIGILSLLHTSFTSISINFLYQASLIRY